MPVGTYGTVKAMTPEDLEGIGAEIVLGNTFHLYLRPGLEVIAAHQGLHRFMHWQRPILTDSGGFQVWSLAEMRKITEEGAHFRSPVDGAPVFLSPEESMRIQRTLASDVAMSFDECTPYPATEARGARVHGIVHALGAARLSTSTTAASRPALCSASCRAASTRTCAWRRWRLWRTSASRVLPSADWRWARATRNATPCSMSCCRTCRRRKPRYLMGVGRPEDIIEAVRRGIDMFDCVMPTRHARNAHLFTRARCRQYPQRRAPQGHRSDRRGMRLLYLPQLQPQLLAASGQVRRNTGRPPEHRPQPVISISG